MNKQEILARYGEPTQVGPAGFVRLIDYMGDDSAIPQAARVSYGAGTKTVREDADLIRFLMRHEHFSPFAMCQIKLHVRLPIFVHNQWVRHDRFHWNVMSGRYSEMPKDMWAPEPEDVRTQGSGNKQVASGEADQELADRSSRAIKTTNELCRTNYEGLLEDGVGREQARTVLPMGQYTEAYVTANLGDWLLFLKQRLSPHAQLEIREYAEAIAGMLSDMFPVTIQAFMDYQMNGVKMSAQEMKWVREALKDPVRILNENPETRKISLGHALHTKRERQEFWKKINE